MVMPESGEEENHLNALKAWKKHCNTYKESSNNNSFKIYHQNICGLLNKLNEINAHL
jgi:hypothetical protein